MIIATPEEFSFARALEFLRRSPAEILHEVRDSSVVKAIRIQHETVVFAVAEAPEGGLVVNFLSATPGEDIRLGVETYVREWFDLDTDLKPFYRMAAKDKLLSPLTEKYYGYRIIGQPDLFESLVWAVLGQQINLGFAYTLKQRFVQQFGERLALRDSEYFLFPSPQTVALITPEKLLALQFSRQKSQYTIAIAEAFTSGALSKEKLSRMSTRHAKEALMEVKGIGNWTANYALMKTFRHPDAFPLEDAGLHNALKKLKNLPEKPNVREVARLFRKYKGWEAYATLYLWRSL